MKLPEEDFGKQLSRMVTAHTEGDTAPSGFETFGSESSGYLGLCPVHSILQNSAILV